MILFIGEFSNNSSDITIPKPHDAILSGNWETACTKHATIYYCDFSKSLYKTHENEHSLILISGENIVTDNLSPYQTQQDFLINVFQSERPQSYLEQINSTFCTAYYNKCNDELVLATDYLGLKKIYLLRLPGRTIFSNALWLIEKYTNNKLTINIDSLVEIGSLGYPLENRTKYNEISILPAGSFIRLCKNNLHSETNYFSLQNTPKHNAIQAKEALSLLHTTWSLAISQRLDANLDVFGFLSGGMDSRLVLHTLKSLGKRVHSANFAPNNSRDLVFGKLAADSIGTSHFQYPIETPGKDLSINTIKAWIEQHPDDSVFFSKKPLIWSGDGGSVGLGHVYLDDEITRHATAGDFLSAAKLFCRKNNRGVPKRLLKDKKAESRLIERIAKIMEATGQTNSSRAPYYFLMLNDQRRHMDHHFENYHRRGFDFHLPFFDKRLISLVAGLNASLVNNHRLYDQLYGFIGNSLTATPWQTYPEHVPCKLEMHQDLKYQWGNDFYTRQQKQAIAKKSGLNILKHILSTQEKPAFNYWYIALASIATWLGIIDHSYINNYIEPLKRSH